MKITELRIGNLVLYNGSGEWKPYKISDTDGLKCVEEDINISYRPIPLTEEWLLKEWFEDCNTNESEGWILWGDVKDNRRLNFCIYKRDGKFTILENCFWLDSIEYVHHLQNIVYDFTRIELK